MNISASIINHTPQTPQTKRLKRKTLIRDQRIAMQTLRRLGLTLQKISEELNLSPRQVQYACERGDISDLKSPGRPPVLNECQVNKLESYVFRSREDRFITFMELAMLPVSHWNVSEKVIERALRRRGYTRCTSQRKPPLSEVNKRKQLLFSQTHFDWTFEQWSNILWTDESWITGGQHA